MDISDISIFEKAQAAAKPSTAVVPRTSVTVTNDWKALAERIATEIPEVQPAPDIVERAGSGPRGSIVLAAWRVPGGSIVIYRSGKVVWSNVNALE